MKCTRVQFLKQHTPRWYRAWNRAVLWLAGFQTTHIPYKWAATPPTFNKTSCARHAQPIRRRLWATVSSESTFSYSPKGWEFPFWSYILQICNLWHHSRQISMATRASAVSRPWQVVTPLSTLCFKIIYIAAVIHMHLLCFPRNFVWFK